MWQLPAFPMLLLIRKLSWLNWIFFFKKKARFLKYNLIGCSPPPCHPLAPRFPVLSPLASFCSLPRLCPHQSHLHTISGLSGLAPKHGYRCTRCAQRKWPPVLIPPLDSLKDPLKPPQTLILACRDSSANQQKRPLLGGAFVDTHHKPAAVPNPGAEKEEGSEVKERKEGLPTVLSVGRWEQIVFSL